MSLKLTDKDLSLWYSGLNVARTQSGIGLSMVSPGKYQSKETLKAAKDLLNNIQQARSSNAFLGMAEYSVPNQVENDEKILLTDRSIIEKNILNLLRVCNNMTCKTVCTNTGTNTNQSYETPCNQNCSKTGNANGVCTNKQDCGYGTTTGTTPNSNGLKTNGAHTNGANSNGNYQNGMGEAGSGTCTNGDNSHGSKTNGEVEVANTNKTCHNGTCHNGSNSQGTFGNAEGNTCHNGIQANGKCSYGTKANNGCNNGKNSNGSNSKDVCILGSVGQYNNGTCSINVCSNGSNSNAYNSKGSVVKSHSNGKNTNGAKSNGTMTLVTPNTNVAKSNVSFSNVALTNKSYSNGYGVTTNSNKKDCQFGTCSNDSCTIGCSHGSTTSYYYNGCTNQIYDGNTATYNAKTRYTEEQAKNRLYYSGDVEIDESSEDIIKG